MVDIQLTVSGTLQENFLLVSEPATNGFQKVWLRLRHKDKQ